jgi:hypothetical protein
LLTGLGEGIVGRDFFVLSHQMGLPVLGFLVLSAALAKSAEQGVR